MNIAYKAGGILASLTPISNCTVDANLATNSANEQFAGGINANGSPTIIRNCVISNNNSYGAVGGVYLAGAKLLDSIITHNQAVHSAGGVRMREGVSLVSNCQVTANDCSPGQCGGVLVDISCGTVSDCIIAGNVSGSYGGGMNISGCLVKNCLIYGNTNLSSHGGGVLMNNVGPYPTYGMINCTIVSNQTGTYGGGVRIYNSSANTNNYIANCIIYDNVTTNDNYDEICMDQPANTNNFWYTCVRPTPSANSTLAPNQGNITNNPLFVDQANCNYHLNVNSPCINTGTNHDYMTNSVDLDGRTRIRYGTVDMGAYELIHSGTIYGFH